MKKTLRKSLSLSLVLILLMSLAVTAFAKPTEWISQSLSDVPVIRISGDGEELVDENGNILHEDVNPDDIMMEDVPLS